MTVRNYSDLVAWQKAIDLVVGIYKVTASFPKEETYSLTTRLRRAAVSVPSNIAEGQGRRSNRDFSRFLSISHGSLRELETQLLIAERLSYIDGKTNSRLLDSAAEVGRLINGLIRKLSRDS